ncbi:hypothetical protein TNCV_3094341 [Trichonephila clavipes]|nr:hypothetical protein TNCV_3094341 [Trichonephila clavipes]
MLGYTQQGCHKTASSSLPLFPARSPDLSPIDHIWDNLRGQVGQPPSLNELATVKRVYENCEKRNVSGHHMKLVCLNVHSHRIVHSH